MTLTPARVRTSLHPIETVAMVVVTVALTVLSYLHKVTCIGAANITEVTRTACYADTISLWGSRGLAKHLVPYVNGTYTTDPPAVHGGTVEYPALTGLFVWVTALPVDTVRGFLVVTLCVFVVVNVITTLLLARVAGHRAWCFAGTPPLALYALYNWDVLPVLMTAVGIALVLAGPRRWSPTTRAVLAGLAFGIGGALKLYPVMFVLPLALGVLLADRRLGLGRRFLRACGPVAAAVGALLAVNLPFAIVNFDGWFSVFRFQAARNIDPSTLSIWYWGLKPWSDDGSARIQHVMTTASTVSTALALVVVVALSLVVTRRRGIAYPWVQTAAAMLCVYMAFNKVDSLQYTLWLLPFFAVVRIRVGWVLAYLAVDLAAFVGWYRWIFYSSIGHPNGSTWADQSLSIGIWGRFALLVCLVGAFLAARTTRTGAPDVPDTPDVPDVPDAAGAAGASPTERPGGTVPVGAHAGSPSAEPGPATSPAALPARGVTDPAL